MVGTSPRSVALGSRGELVPNKALVAGSHRLCRTPLLARQSLDEGRRATRVQRAGIRPRRQAGLVDCRPAPLVAIAFSAFASQPEARPSRHSASALKCAPAARQSGAFARGFGRSPAASRAIPNKRTLCQFSQQASHI